MLQTQPDGVVGIDPDLNGGLVHIVGDEIQMLRWLPLLDDERRLDAEAFLKMLPCSGVERVIVEEAIVRPQAGRGGAAMTRGIHTAHQTYGAVRALVETVYGRDMVKTVRPSTWKASMGLTSDKDLSRKRAAELHPSHQKVFALKKSHGLAEAVLLAHYGRKLFCTRVH